MGLGAQMGLLPCPMLMRIGPAVPLGNRTGATPAPCAKRIWPHRPGLITGHEGTVRTQIARYM